MQYSRVHLEALGYELAPVVVSTAELEERLAPLYRRLHIPEGQLEQLTGIHERRWWEPGTPLWQGATKAAEKALAKAGIAAQDLGAVVYTGVCRDAFEPATACRVAAELGVAQSTFVYDISNACLGALNGMIDVANRIELGQIRAGLVVTCETAREIVDTMTRRMLEEGTLELFRYALATLTGGSGAVACLLTDGSFGPRRRALLGGVSHAAPQHHDLCRWGLVGEAESARVAMRTDSVAVLEHGVKLGVETWRAFREELPGPVDKVVCHQVGRAHQEEILRRLEIPPEKDCTSYAFLGNMGTVSLPLTAALGEERGFLRPGERVAMLGIGSGLNCMMLGFRW